MQGDFVYSKYSHPLTEETLKEGWYIMIMANGNQPPQVSYGDARYKKAMEEGAFYSYRVKSLKNR